jgi:hypothetical protein
MPPVAGRRLLAIAVLAGAPVLAVSAAGAGSSDDGVLRLPSRIDTARASHVDRSLSYLRVRHGRRVVAPAFPSRRAVRAARRYVRGRALSSFALIDSRGRLHGWAPHRRYISASVVKAMLLVARLRQLGNHLPGASDRAVLEPMIEVSDNDAADVAYDWIGDAGLLALARRAHMRDLTVAGYWGSTFFSASDQARFFLRVDRLVPRRSRGYARRLLSSIVGYQRWGFARVARRHGWRSFFKGGWRETSTGSLVHEAALFERGRRRFSLAVLTDGNRSHDYGTQTLRGVATRIFR